MRHLKKFKVKKPHYLFNRLLARAALVSSGVVALLPAEDGLAGSVLLPASSNKISCDCRTNIP